MTWRRLLAATLLVLALTAANNCYDSYHSPWHDPPKPWLLERERAAILQRWLPIILVPGLLAVGLLTWDFVALRRHRKAHLRKENPT